MYGHLNFILRGYVLDWHGEDVWNSVVRQAQCGDTFDTTAVYDDGMTQKILDAIVKITGLKRDPLLVLIGQYYFTYVQGSEHGDFMKNIGGNILDFIQNLDSLHSAMSAHYPEMNPPSFRCEADSSADRITLHYYSFRKGYAHLVIGLLQAVAKAYYKMDLTITILSITNEKLSSKHSTREHVLFNVLATSADESPQDDRPTLIAQTKKHGEKQILKQDVEAVKRRLEQIRSEYGEEALPLPRHRAQLNRAKWRAVAKMSILRRGFVINYPESLAINPRRFCEVFPYHFVFDPKMRIFQSGEQLQKLAPTIQARDSSVLAFFHLVSPHSLDFTYDNIKKFINTPFVLRVNKDKLGKESQHASEDIILKGQMIELPAENMMLYLSSPFVRTFSHLEERKLYYANIPGHDVTRDMLFMNIMHSYSTSNAGSKSRSPKRPHHYNHAVVRVGDADDNEDLYAELERTRSELEQERQRNAELMYHFLPSSVASNYISKQKFRAGDYHDVSVLFCDIVNFLQYPTECRVSSVISLLNQLTEKFERINRVHDTFRVETIGDAYLVLSGIPDKTSSHAERIANTALAMLYACEDVKSPISWSREVQVRIGMHSGSLQCGVVGNKVPRLIVMGETVTIASRMESHGEAGRVHVTPSVYNALRDKGFVFRERGLTSLRNVGDLITYFLVSNDAASPEELMGWRTKEDQVSFINDRDHSISRPSGKHNKVKPVRSSPSSGVGSGSSRHETEEDDVVPFFYNDNVQHKTQNKKK